MKTLIVDDNDDNLYMLETLLKGNGYTVATARNGIEALERLKAEGADMIISDILMPRMDGFQLCRTVRSDNAFNAMPFIFYTATYTDQKDIELGLSLGADRFLIKPQDTDAILQAIADVIAERAASTSFNHPLGEEMEFFRQYNEALFRKLEKKMADQKQAEDSLRASIRQMKAMEEQLRQAQKLEAIGQLAGGVAHDFNNILNAIMGFASLMDMKMSHDDPNRLFVKQILDASNRATVLTQSLLAFSRKQTISPARIDLCKTVENFQKFLLRLLREDIELKVVCKEDEIPVFADRGQIEQVLMNLVTNARDSISQCGQIIIETSLVELDDAFVRMHGFGEPGNYALLAVTDTGCGMTDTIKKNVFDPFFTTKEVGKGTGLGLSMVYGIVKQHKGAIDIYSEPEIGTTFKIYLPLDRGEVSADTQPEQDEKPVGGCETILLAEDDSALRNLAATILKQYGYTVIEATDGIDALDKFTTHRDKIDLVISDGIMPKMSGKDAVQEIRQIAPEMKAIFISGYAEDIFSSKAVSDDNTLFVQKPVQPSVLIRSVRKVLDG